MTRIGPVVAHACVASWVTLVGVQLADGRAGAVFFTVVAVVAWSPAVPLLRGALRPAGVALVVVAVLLGLVGLLLFAHQYLIGAAIMLGLGSWALGTNAARPGGSTSRTCPAGHPIGLGARFCGVCGTRI